jgi:16S rRNA G966 N2-methylase RsmD
MSISTIKSDVFKYLERAGQKFTIIFADPPYNFPVEEFSKIPELVFQNELLNEDGLLIVEHSKHTDLSHLQHYSHSKNYGGNCFSFFKIA